MDAPRYSEEYLPPINPISASQSRGGTIQNSHDSLPVIESAPTTAEIASKKSTTDELLELLDRFSHHKRVSMSPLDVDDSDDDSDAETLDDFDEVEEDDDQNDKDRAMKRKQTRIARAITKIENRKRDKHLDQFIVLLGNSLQEYGCPTATMETHMEHVAEGLGRPTRFAFFDGYAFATWKGENGRDQTLLFGTYSGLNLYKLQLCDELTRHVAAYSRPSDRIHTAFFERLNYSPQTKTILRYIGGTLFGVRLRGSYTSYDPEQGSLVNMTDKILELAAVSPNLFGQYKRANSKKLKKKHTTFVTTDEGDGRGKKQEPSINRAPTLRHVQTFKLIAVSDALNRLMLIRDAPPLYPPWVLVLTSALWSAFTCAVFFDGLWNDVAASFVIGLALGVVSLLCSRDWNWMRICEFLSAVIIGFCIRLMSIWNWAICPGSVTIATFINLVQGTNITLAVMELASKHPGAGVSRLGYSLTITALIGIGLQFGNAVASGIAAQTVSNTDLLRNCSAGMSIPTQWGLFIPALFILFINLRAHPRQFFYMAVVAVTAKAVAYYSYQTLKDPASSFLATLTMSILSNVYSHITHTNPIVGMLAGLQVLVPGALAVKAFAQSDATDGISLAGSVLTIALSLGLGLFVGSVVSSGVIGINKNRRFKVWAV